MEHKELMEVLQKEWQMEKKDCKTILNTLLQLIGDAATMMHSVTITNFGTFRPSKTAERVVVNNDTHASMLMPPEIRLTYTASCDNSSEQTITENDLATLLAKRTTIPEEKCLQIVSSSFRVIAEASENGESIMVLNFGVFSSHWIASSERYEREFAPDKQMREWVNAPFASFSPEPLITKETPSEETVETLTEVEQVVTEEREAETPAPTPTPTAAATVATPEPTIIAPKKREKTNSGFIVIVALLVAAIIVGIYFLYMKTATTEKPSITVVIPQPPISEPTVIEEPKAVAVEIETEVVDTIRKGVFMTTLALKHYGNKSFWVYIYEENKAHIKNPNAVPPNTPVVIPPKGKYQIDAANPAAIERADSLAEEIKKTLQTK